MNMRLALERRAESEQVMPAIRLVVGQREPQNTGRPYRWGFLLFVDGLRGAVQRGADP
jgi:hypothetical protein